MYFSTNFIFSNKYDYHKLSHHHPFILYPTHLLILYLILISHNFINQFSPSLFLSIYSYHYLSLICLVDFVIVLLIII